MRKIIYNAKIHTMDKSYPQAEALLIENNKIVKVGSNEDVFQLKNCDTELIDCEGRLVIPGLNDSHMHLYGFSSYLKMINLANVKSINDIILVSKKYIDEKKPTSGSWLKGRGWNQDYFIDDKRFPNRFDLDQISTSYPIVLSRTCGHIASCNSKALQLCGINKDTKQIEGGHIDLDHNGEPTGIFREKAMDLLLDHSNLTLDDLKSILLEGMKYANTQGLTSIQTDDLAHLPNKDYKMMIRAYEELAKEGKLTCRINQQCLLPNKEALTKFLSLGYTTRVGNEFYKMGPLKILSDGSLGARTAAMTQPYADDHSTSGIMCFTQDELDEMILIAHKANMQVAVHCIGDLSMHMVLSSIEKALKEYPKLDHRHGIIHCQITDEAILNKYKELNVIAYVQPIFLHYDLHIVEDRVGKDLASTSYAFKTMLNKGIQTAYSTDCPVEPLDTMPNIYCAVTRQDLSTYPQGGWISQEKVSVEEAIYQYTMGSAYASFEENIKGSITVGKFADIVVLNEDIFTIDANKIKDVKIDMTFVGGNLVYKR
ncbi:MAG: hypothetical protein K0Q49_1223 [Haloplasmataceae bacterium]|jgi:predicted amidohydrolase YtcJ|nr:hypothetical protein [Haloplasmataceae bacterium]